MNPEETIKIAEQVIREFFLRLGVAEIPVVTWQDGETLAVILTMEDPKAFIGERGQTLFEIQHLLRTMLRKKFQQSPPHIFLDINDYRKRWSFLSAPTSYRRALEREKIAGWR
ncbi:MAG: hypothetical protein HYT39_04230 [Candidatus Sungbacteria bacterium]|nr:hypothetical protein [Candidatus Sungbacteria bacterium]